MAEKKKAEKAEEAEGEKKPAGGKKKLIIIIVAAVLLLGGGTAGTLYFMGMLGGGGDKAKHEEEAPKADEHANKKEPHYYAFEQPFTVNFETETGLRYLQVGVEMMSYDPAAIEAVKTHSPVIRNNIILLFSNQSFETLVSREGKEKLRADTLKEIQAVLTKYHGQPGVEEVYFTSFVMQ